MYVETYVTSCDLSGVKYPSAVKGCAAIAQGATGRYCEVIHFGPEYIAEHGLKVLSREEAIAIIEERGDGYADF